MAYVLNYQAPYGNFHFLEGLMTVSLAEELIVDLALAQRIASQRVELLGDRTVAELIVVPSGHLLLDPSALSWWTDPSSMGGVHHRALVVPARTKLWREIQMGRKASSESQKLRVFSSERKARNWVAKFEETVTPQLARESAVGVDVTTLVGSKSTNAAPDRAGLAKTVDSVDQYADA